MPRLEEIQEMLKMMSEEDKDNLIQLLLNEKKKVRNDGDLLKLQNNYRCPYCQSTKINKNGTAHKNLPQFICRNCKKTYTIRTNTIFYYSKKNIALWREYIELFSQGLALRKIVIEMNNKISLPTAFYWRHKILEVMKNFDNHDKLDGIVEADETYFNESQKGNKNITNRKPRKRGFSSENRIVGLSHNKVCVLTALDRNKHSFNKPVGYGKVCKEQVAILQHRIKDNSILITDGDKSYKILKDIKLKQLKFGKAQSKVYHLSNINNFHSKLKQFMSRFNGVATKYLDNYVNYFNDIRNRIDYFNQLLQLQGCYRLVDLRKRKVCFENAIITR